MWLGEQYYGASPPENRVSIAYDLVDRRRVKTQIAIKLHILNGIHRIIILHSAEHNRLAHFF